MKPTYYLGLDVGAETVKVVALEKRGNSVVVAEMLSAAHNKEPHAAILALLSRFDLRNARGIAATGRLQRLVNASSVPTKSAMRRGVRLVHSELAGITVLSVGAHGFSVLELGANGEEWFQQNSRCSQGTGNFLSQLVNRFGLTVEEASELCDQVPNAAPLSGRCPVILKTDMTHLANKGEDKARILAGLYDAVCENVLTLVRPRLAPRDVVLTGGVTRSSRVRRTIGKWLETRGLHLVPARDEDGYLEAIGAATHGMDHPCEVPSAEALLAHAAHARLDKVPSLKASLAKVNRLPKLDLTGAMDVKRHVYFGLDIGSTGSKAVAIDAVSGECVWETYLNTEGAPVQAGQRLIERWVEGVGDKGVIVGFGVTGSGREIVGSLLRTCYGDDRVFVMNEIAAHARGAVAIDPLVDTIFEIGGQDAKYIRLEGGRVIDAAMNEACSAGTGSFIAEQGSKFEGVGEDIARLGKLGLDADFGISLGQHCSVFMAEVIDEAITQGMPRDAIIAGLYDSVIQNYLNRVKGTRTVGQRVFCQGMPFSSDSLAAAVARQTGCEVVVPPNPGTIGAYGIALLVNDQMKVNAKQTEPTEPSVFLGARVDTKETFVCNSTKGCGGSGNHCRIDRLTTLVDGVKQRFIWGGNCSLYDRGGGRGKLPDLAPDPFRERAALLEDLISKLPENPAGKTIALTDEFALKTLAPLFVVFLNRLGFKTTIARNANGASLRKGIEGARVPYCAPVQLYHGVFFELAEKKADYFFLPMVLDLPRAGKEINSVVCPLVQASPDLVGSLLTSRDPAAKVLRPVIRFDAEGYSGAAFTACLKGLAEELGALDKFESACRAALATQVEYDESCLRIGKEALAFCEGKNVVPIVVLGRPYTIHNDVLNSNVPSILRSLGAMAIPIDCLPVPADIPIYDDQYWGHTQRNLRAAEHIRRTSGLYSVFCSNYACGPDSFTLHFYSYIMQGKPFAVVETDGHSGDAGTKTRMEAFLFCVDTDLRANASDFNPISDFKALEDRKVGMDKVKDQNAVLLIPRMGAQSELAAAALRAEGYRAETLPFSTQDDIRMGRRHTSGKECVPMMLTAGTMLNRLERAKTSGAKDKFVFLMPTASGPCRFGVYNTLHKIVLEQAGYGSSVEIVSPDDGDYFRGMSSDFSIRLWLGFCTWDLLQMMLFEVRPVERRKGAANEIFDRYIKELLDLAENSPKASAFHTMKEIFGGLWGTKDLLTRAVKEFSAIKNRVRDVPSVAIVGEIYVRLDPFANDFVIDKLEQRGIRVRFAPFIEWLEYTSFLAEERVIDKQMRHDDNPVTIGLTSIVQRATLDTLYNICAKPLEWGPRLTVKQSLDAAEGYISSDLTGEACLTLGGPVHEFKDSLVQGVVIVGPHECMPCKISEAQFGKVAEDMNLPYLSLTLNGEPLDTEALDRFAYDIHETHARGVGKSFEGMMNKFGNKDSAAHQEVPTHQEMSDPSLITLRLGKDKPKSQTLLD